MEKKKSICDVIDCTRASLWRLWKAISDTSVFRLDVRKEAERKSDGFIPGTVLIDIQKPDFEQKAYAVLPKDRTITVMYYFAPSEQPEYSGGYM